MRFSAISLTAVALMAQSSFANWLVSSYESSCGTGKGGTLTAGQPDDELWCITTSASHNVVVEGFEADKMEMWLFSSWNCNEPGAEIAHIDTDGCHVIPSDTVIEAVRILPKA